VYALGAVVATAIAVFARRVRALNNDGATAAVAVGTVTFGALGPGGAAVLLAFFVPSVAFSRLGRARKRTLLVDVEKSSARDVRQVVANGGVAAVCALAARRGDGRYATAFAGALAAANADTWGTEIGTLARGRPRSILTWRLRPAGLSGGVTFAGTLAELGGAALVAFVAARTLPIARRSFAIITTAGFAGAIVDSLLGASLQRLFWCDACRRATERRRHVCGGNTRRIRGLACIDNDAVNIAATLTGALVAYAAANQDGRSP